MRGSGTPAGVVDMFMSCAFASREGCAIGAADDIVAAAVAGAPEVDPSLKRNVIISWSPMLAVCAAPARGELFLGDSFIFYFLQAAAVTNIMAFSDAVILCVLSSTGGLILIEIRVLDREDHTFHGLAVFVFFLVCVCKLVQLRFK